jgi:redox-sensitive bicupin YhaK (pirin superfamily)
VPAITVPDFTVLPRLSVPAPSARPRRVAQVHTAPSGVEGEGFPVRRAFAGVDLADLDPFIHMDQMGAVDYGPGEPKGTPWHPHRGFETVTYIIDGAFVHQDSAGGGGRISDGDTQWMTAGSGLLHIEAPPEALVMSGGLFHGVQLWVNLPAAQKWHGPRYQDLRATDQTLVTSHDGGALVRLIAGELDGHLGPGATLTPIAMAHATLTPGAQLRTGWDPSSNCLVYALAGRGRIGTEQAVLRTGQLAVLGPGDCLTLTGDRPGGADFDVLLLGGRPIREPVAWAGPFVMNTRAEVLAAFDDYRSGRLGTIPPPQA